jgi:hypothetical protein
LAQKRDVEWKHRSTHKFPDMLLKISPPPPR